VKNDNDPKESARITEAFRTHDTINKIVDRFKFGESVGIGINKNYRDDSDDSDDGSDSDGSDRSASEPDEAAGFFDRQILKDAVEAAYKSFKDENTGSATQAIKEVFSKAKKFRESPDEARNVVNDELKKCYEGLDDAMKLELDMLFFKHDPITEILNWFYTFNFATPDVLKDAARGIYQYFIDNKNDLGEKKSQEIDEELEGVIEAAFAPWRKLNGENLDKPRRPIIKRPFPNDLREDSTEEGDLIEKLQMEVVISDPRNKKISYTGKTELNYDPPPSPSEKSSNHSN